MSRSWTIGRDIFFSAEDYTNVVVLDQSTVTFQKGWGEGVITICVILDQSTVIFLKKKWGGGITICVVLDPNHGNVMFYQLVSNLQSMFPS